MSRLPSEHVHYSTLIMLKVKACKLSNIQYFGLFDLREVNVRF